MERPRTKGARWTNKHIAADEKVEEIHLASFDAKRDRWNGYNSGARAPAGQTDAALHARCVQWQPPFPACQQPSLAPPEVDVCAPATHPCLVHNTPAPAEEWVKYADRFERVQQMRQEVRKQELLEKQQAGEVDEEAVADELEADELKVDETEEAGFGKVEKRVRTVGGGSTGTVRNLRIREDTAKYLLNLDINSGGLWGGLGGGGWWGDRGLLVGLGVALLAASPLLLLLLAEYLAESGLTPAAACTWGLACLAHAPAG